ncbi:hypothetical protein L1D14_10430 [Vibrio tubiashii]|uniref:hypothetical protein n=1 Tax=Vibrio tubiashii TaxID=29498 RepID=UPI001EFD4C1C|nr:hypothetical protein [Vibrio tubiashii]MCG9576653.1 hypothetical protein [Vibrio tubiashii]
MSTETSPQQLNQNAQSHSENSSTLHQGGKSSVARRHPAKNVTKAEAKLVGANLGNQKIRTGLVEGIPANRFDEVRQELTAALNQRGEQIQIEQQREAQYRQKVDTVSQELENTAKSQDVEIQDVVRNMTTRSKLYVFPEREGGMGRFMGKGPKPAGLQELLDKGHNLEEFEVNISDFL